MLSQSQIAQVWGPPCRGPYANVRLHGTGQVTVKASLIEATKALNACLQRWNYQTIYSQTGGQNCRQKVGGNGWSNHSYGTAIDVNWQRNPYGGSRHEIPTSLAIAICQIRTNNGRQVWNWGGFWRGTKDWMHFEIVCSPRDIATGINWGTVNGRVPVIVPLPPTPVLPPYQFEEDEDMSTLIRHHNDQIWLYSGLTRTYMETKNDVDFYKFLGAKYVDLKNDPAASQRLLDDSVDIKSVAWSHYWSKAAFDRIGKILAHFKIKG